MKLMIRKLNGYANLVLVFLRSIIASRFFLPAVIALFVLQALWVAVSFRYPLLFDERFHLGAIDYFAHQLSPIALSQDPRYDTYGNMAFGSASLYHYLMGLPYRLILNLTDNIAEQVVLMRAVNVLLAASGLILFAKLLRSMGISKAITNLTILFFSIIPVFIYVAATVSYDNMLFPVTAYFFIVCVWLTKKSKTPQAFNYAKLLLVGATACLIKFTFLPIFATAILYIVIRDYRVYRRKYLPKLLHSIRLLNTQEVALIVVFGVVIVSLFSVRYLYPVAKYHSIMPGCSATMSEQRCSNGALEKLVKKGAEEMKTRDTLSLSEFSSGWYRNMSTNYIGSAANTGTAILFAKNFPVMHTLVKIMGIVGIVALILMWRSLKPPPSWGFLALLIAVFFLTLFVFNASAYYSSNADTTQSRYALSVIPVLMGMSAVAINKLLRDQSLLKTAALMLLLLACTQGGGITTHVVSSNSQWYWDNPKLIKVNNEFRNVVDPLVIDRDW